MPGRRRHGDGNGDAGERRRPGGPGNRAGAWAEILAAIRAGYVYANVHSTKWPTGEIRGQLNEGDDQDDSLDDDD